MSSKSSDKYIGSYVDSRYNRNKTTVWNDKRRYHGSNQIGTSTILYLRSHSVFHCCTHQSAPTSVTHSRRWAHKRVESSCCKPKLSNGRQDRVRIIIMRTKSGIRYIVTAHLISFSFSESRICQWWQGFVILYSNSRLLDRKAIQFFFRISLDAQAGLACKKSIWSLELLSVGTWGWVRNCGTT